MNILNIPLKLIIINAKEGKNPLKIDRQAQEGK
jgi:hypothetical protein